MSVALISKIYVDYDRYSCSIFTDTNQVITIVRETPLEVAYKIRNFTSVLDKTGKIHQNIDISVENLGEGIYIIDLLRSFGLKVIPITNGNTLKEHMIRQEIIK